MWSEQKWNFSRGNNLITGGLIPGLGRSPGEGKDYPLQYSGLKNPYSPWGGKKSDMTKPLSLSLFSVHVSANNDWIAE